MIIFINSMKRIFRNKVLIAVMLILPLLPMIPIVTENEVADKEFKVGIADLDKTLLSNSLIKRLDSNCIIVNMKENEISEGLAYRRVDYGIVINKGYSNRIIEGKNPMLQGYSKKGMNLSKLISSYIDSYMNPVRNIAAASGNNRTKFYRSLKYYNKGLFSLKTGTVKRNKTNADSVSWGMVVMFMMFTSTYSATQLLTDKDNKTFFRTLAAPVRIKNYMLQKILSYLVVSILQVTVLVPVLIILFGVYPGIWIINMYLLFLVFSLVAVSLGIAISSFAKSVITGSVIGVGISLIASILGGAWGSMSNGEVIKRIGHMLPTYWVMDGVNKLLDDRALSSIGSDMGILLIFSAIFFLLGTWRKEDIAK